MSWMGPKGCASSRRCWRNWRMGCCCRRHFYVRCSVRRSVYRFVPLGACKFVDPWWWELVGVRFPPCEQVLYGVVGPEGYLYVYQLRTTQRGWRHSRLVESCLWCIVVQGTVLVPACWWCIVVQGTVLVPAYGWCVVVQRTVLIACWSSICSEVSATLMPHNKGKSFECAEQRHCSII
jgi:hypothetical protein